MRAWACGIVMVVVAVAGDEASDKVKRQIYYSDSERTGHLPLSPEYPDHSGDLRPRPPPRPAYEEPPRPTYEEPQHRDGYNNENSIPGEPGVDYPIYDKVPYTKFVCADVPYRPGIYANPEAGCQVYHVCDDDRYGPQGAQFLCTNGTVFNQAVFTCDWWYNVDCSKATSFYSLNEDPEYNPYYQKPYEGPLNTPAPYGSPEVYGNSAPAPYQPEPAPYRPAPSGDVYYQ